MNTRFDIQSDPYSGKPYQTIAFVGNKVSANERGHLPVMIHSITPDETLNPATFENMVKSFRDHTGGTSATHRDRVLPGLHSTSNFSYWRKGEAAGFGLDDSS